VAAPLGLILSLVGLVLDKKKAAAITGLAAIGLAIALFAIVAIC
jgi:hypothetical protein